MKKRAEIVVFLLGLAIILLAALNSSRFFARLDLTESKAFSISRVSKKLFQEIPEQVYITYYVSDRLRKLYSFPQQVEDLLQEYAAYSRGKIRVESLDPLAAGGGTRAGQYIGVLLLGCAGISVGLFVSSLATNQVSSFLVSLFVLLVFTLISQVNLVFSLPILLARVFNYLALGAHFNNFQKGLVDTRDLLNYLLGCALFLYLNVKTLVFKNW